MAIEKTVEIPEQLLVRLRSKQERISHSGSAISEAKNLLVRLNVFQDGEHSWNGTINWLEDHYPGWRGFEIRYQCGRIG